jgi:myo-inositol-1(or 4)-monophosphatase
MFRYDCGEDDKEAKMLEIDELIDLTSEIKEKTRKYMKEDVNFGEYVPEGKEDTKRIDLFAERALDEALRSRGLEARIISEEFGERIIGGDPDFTLVFDPVDGTRNAVRGIPFYCTSLAYSEKIEDVYFDDISMGVVSSFSGDIYHAVKGEGSFINGKRSQCKINNDRILISIHAYDFPPFSREDLEKRIIMRTLGSIAIELSLVANGGLDIVLDTRGKLGGYDIMAGQLILRESGGYLIDLDGKDINERVTKRGISLIASNDEDFIAYYRNIGDLKL